MSLVSEPTERELEILRLLAVGQTQQQIAEELGISPGTVKVHLDKAKIRLGAITTVNAVAIAIWYEHI